MRSRFGSLLAIAALVAAAMLSLVVHRAAAQIPSCYDEHGNLKSPEQYKRDEQSMREAARANAKTIAEAQARGLYEPFSKHAKMEWKLCHMGNFFSDAAKHGQIDAQMQMAEAYMDSTCSECDERTMQRILVKDYSKALVWWRKVADRRAGHTLGNMTFVDVERARNRVGEAYLYGLGVGADAAEATRWFLASLEASDDRRLFLIRPEAQTNLMLCMREHPAASLPIVRAAAERGNTDAQFMLGCALLEGDGGAQSDADAVAWWQKAAKVNWAAQYQLAWAYRTGHGVQADDAEGVRRSQKLADLKYLPALLEMASRYRMGRGVVEDRERAMALCRTAATMFWIPNEDGRTGVATAKAWLQEMGASN